jgi:flavin-dependent dehydrogenase
MGELGLSPNFEAEEFYPIDRFVIYGPKGTATKIDLAPCQEVGTRVVRRYRFDDMLRLHAIQSGARFRQLNVQGLIFNQDQVVGIEARSARQKIEIHSRVVIAADGSTSTVARALKQPRPGDKNLAVALRGFVRTVSDLDRSIELSFLKEFHPGYAWFLPVGKRLASVGIGMQVEHFKEKRLSLSKALALYLERPEIRARVGLHKVEGLKSWQLPMFSNNQRRLFDGVILVGDAGGFVNPLTGDGIYQAMVTARYAAEACIDAIQKSNLTAGGLSLYEKLLRTNTLGEMRRALIMKRFLNVVPAGVDALLLTARLLPVLANRVIADYGTVQAITGL